MDLYIHTLTHTAILTSFLLHDLPSHIALVSSQVFMLDYVCSFSPLFIRVAHAVHEVVALLPSDSVDTYEREELHWQPRSESSSVLWRDFDLCPRLSSKVMQ